MTTVTHLEETGDMRERGREREKEREREREREREIINMQNYDAKRYRDNFLPRANTTQHVFPLHGAGQRHRRCQKIEDKPQRVNVTKGQM